MERGVRLDKVPRPHAVALVQPDLVVKLKFARGWSGREEAGRGGAFCVFDLLLALDV